MDSRVSMKGGHRILHKDYMMGPTRVHRVHVLWLVRNIDRSSYEPMLLSWFRGGDYVLRGVISV